jgi:hypothetical protein
VAATFSLRDLQLKETCNLSRVRPSPSTTMLASCATLRFLPTCHFYLAAPGDGRAPPPISAAVVVSGPINFETT